MKLEDQVCSLELAKRLKELGMKQESEFSYIQCRPNEVPLIDWCKEIETSDTIVASAFTVAELAELMKNKFIVCAPDLDDGAYGRYEEAVFCSWQISNPNYIKEKKRVFKANKMADAYAKMLIYLLENKLIKI